MIQKSAKMRKKRMIQKRSKKEQKGANKNIVIIIMVFVLKKINKIKS